MASEVVVQVRGLRKSYGDHEAVRGVDFEIPRGTVFGLLGPNGAGKTTIVEILEGYRTRSDGEVSVLGADPERDEIGLRDRIGIVLQESGLEPDLTVREAVDLYGAAYSRRRPTDEIVGLIGLTDKLDARISTLSGGQRRRLDLALGVVGDPELIFLDEPTTGFDPAARRAAWDLVASLREGGVTVRATMWVETESQKGILIGSKGRMIKAIGTAARREIERELGESVQRARRSCSPPTTWTRRSSWPIGSRCSRPVRSSPRARRPSSQRATSRPRSRSTFPPASAPPTSRFRRASGRSSSTGGCRLPPPPRPVISPRARSSSVG